MYPLSYGCKLDRGSLPSETLKSGSLGRGPSTGSAEGTASKGSSPWGIAQMCRFKFSPERPPRSRHRMSDRNRGITTKSLFGGLDFVVSLRPERSTELTPKSQAEVSGRGLSRTKTPTYHNRRNNLVLNLTWYKACLFIFRV